VRIFIAFYSVYVDCHVLFVTLEKMYATFDIKYFILYIIYMLQNRIKVYRAEKNLTQQQLAEAIGVIRQTVIAIEQNKYQPSVVLALKLAHYFNVSVEELFQLNFTI
jgi:putative transcriptional regulator